MRVSLNSRGYFNLNMGTRALPLFTVLVYRSPCPWRAPFRPTLSGDVGAVIRKGKLSLDKEIGSFIRVGWLRVKFYHVLLMVMLACGMGVPWCSNPTSTPWNLKSS
ncbi:hypothetical protein BJY04DRAFT_128716 [Aspergillus karnatakaensis]|uniref:uncharacterized protein n=1 Tax=Aspergillus karnatakaensis TaxID=1810916 RepID=UPI003CCCDBA3